MVVHLSPLIPLFAKYLQYYLINYFKSIEYISPKEGIMIKSLVRHGNNRALVIDKALLQAAGLDEDKALFQITIDPNGGVLIRSVKIVNDDQHKETFRQVLQENDALMKRLSKR
jgi:antitoxin component of MazEF toxin-antitoxin module